MGVSRATLANFTNATSENYFVRQINQHKEQTDRDVATLRRQVSITRVVIAVLAILAFVGGSTCVFAISDGLSNQLLAFSLGGGLGVVACSLCVFALRTVKRANRNIANKLEEHRSYRETPLSFDEFLVEGGTHYPEVPFVEICATTSYKGERWKSILQDQRVEFFVKEIKHLLHGLTIERYAFKKRAEIVHRWGEVFCVDTHEEITKKLAFQEIEHLITSQHLALLDCETRILVLESMDTRYAKGLIRSISKEIAAQCFEDILFQEQFVSEQALVMLIAHHSKTFVNYVLTCQEITIDRALGACLAVPHYGILSCVVDELKEQQGTNPIKSSQMITGIFQQIARDGWLYGRPWKRSLAYYWGLQESLYYHREYHRGKYWWNRRDDENWKLASLEEIRIRHMNALLHQFRNSSYTALQAVNVSLSTDEGPGTDPIMLVERTLDVVKYIFSQLDTQSLRALACVSKDWRKCTIDYVWTNIKQQALGKYRISKEEAENSPAREKVKWLHEWIEKTATNAQIQQFLQCMLTQMQPLFFLMREQVDITHAPFPMATLANIALSPKPKTTLGRFFNDGSKDEFIRCVEQLVDTQEIQWNAFDIFNQLNRRSRLVGR